MSQLPVNVFGMSPLAAAPVTEQVGAWRASELLTAAAGRTVHPDTVPDLVAAGLLTQVGKFRGNPLYDAAAVRELGARPDFGELLYDHQLLGPNQAAVRLEIRRIDFDYVIAAGWLTPAAVRSSKVSRRKWIDFPVYHPREVDALRDLPGVDWESVRGVKPGSRSPLREYAAKPPTRAATIRWFCTKLSKRFRVQVWAWWDNSRDTWHIDWDTANNKPTRKQVEKALAGDPVIAQYRDQIVLGCESLAVVRWARSMVQPGAAVVLDVETTDLYGRVIELSVVDAATGAVLLDTLVNPGVPITGGAYAVHGISDAMVADAPDWEQVLPRLLAVCEGRTVLAYNSEHDQTVVVDHTRALGLDPGWLADTRRWGCIMVNRTAWERQWHWIRLGAGHRALGDALAARDVLHAMTTPYR